MIISCSLVSLFWQAIFCTRLTNISSMTWFSEVMRWWRALFSRDMESMQNCSRWGQKQQWEEKFVSPASLEMHNSHYGIDTSIHRYRMNISIYVLYVCACPNCMHQPSKREVSNERYGSTLFPPKQSFRSPSFFSHTLWLYSFEVWMAGCLQHHFTKKGRPQPRCTSCTMVTPSVPVRAAQDAGGQICINEQSFDAIDDIFASRLSAGPGPRMALGPGPWAWLSLQWRAQRVMGHKDPTFGWFLGGDRGGGTKKGHDNGGYPNEFFAESNLKYHEHTHCTWYLRTEANYSNIFNTSRIPQLWKHPCIFQG